MRIEEMVSNLAEAQDATGPADERAIWAFAEACDRADTDKGEGKRIRDIVDWIDAEDAIYAQAFAELDRGDHVAASSLLRQCARAGIGESAWLLGSVLDEAGNATEAIAWYRHAAAHDGDSRAEVKLAELLARPRSVSENVRASAIRHSRGRLIVAAAGSAPTWSAPGGAGPFDERDLETLLAALQAAPARGELSGEAAARAAFRMVSPVPGPWSAEAEHGTVTARTLSLPPIGRGERRTRRRRHETGATRRPVTVAVGVAAAAVIAVGVGLTGVLPTAITRLAHFGHRPNGASASASSTAVPSAAQRVEGTGSRTPTGMLTPTTSAASGAPHTKQSPGELCREYYSFFEHQEPPSSYAAEAALRIKLNALAGSPAQVFGYCTPYLGYFSGGVGAGNKPLS